MIDLSIIIPTFRREREVVEAASSALRLSRPGVEVLVVDDSPEGSAEKAVTALADPRLTYQRRKEPTGGRPARVRNEAVAATRGRVLYFLDDDDRVIPEHLALALGRLDASPAGVLVSTPKPFGADPGLVEEERRYFAGALALLAKPRSRYRVVARLLFGNTLLVCSTCLVKRETFLAEGGFDAAIPLCEDVEFYLRAIRAGGFVYSPEPILERRIGQPSLMTDNKKTDLVARSYQLFQRKYRTTRGLPEFAALKLWNKLS